jgi:NADH-quinone oxidoreductase subunit J
MVLFLFVVMLLNVSSEEEEGNDARPRFVIGSGPRRFGAVLAVLLAVQLIWALRTIADAPFVDDGTSSTVKDIGLRLFRDYAFAFEATSILILVAMVGAVIIARKER